MSGKVNLLSKQFKKNTLDISLDRMIEPVMYNVGDVPAIIHGIFIPPGNPSGFSFAFTGAETYGTTSVVFPEEGNKKVILLYGKQRQESC